MCRKDHHVKVKIGGKKIEVDWCMVNLMNLLNSFGIDVVGSCCGHKKYDMTIVICGIEGKKKLCIDLISGERIKRDFNERNPLYLKDKQGCFYLPESVKAKGKKTKNFWDTSKLKLGKGAT